MISPLYETKLRAACPKLTGRAHKLVTVESKQMGRDDTLSQGFVLI
jgi:hypothetical protein